MYTYAKEDTLDMIDTPGLVLIWVSWEKVLIPPPSLVCWQRNEENKMTSLIRITRCWDFYYTIHALLIPLTTPNPLSPASFSDHRSAVIETHLLDTYIHTGYKWYMLSRYAKRYFSNGSTMGQRMNNKLTSIYRNSHSWLWRFMFTSFWCFSLAFQIVLLYIYWFHRRGRGPSWVSVLRPSSI